MVEEAGAAGFNAWKRRGDFMNWDTIRSWAAIVLLLDAAFGLWNHERLEKAVPKLKVVRIALLEALASLFLIVVPYLF